MNRKYFKLLFVLFVLASCEEYENSAVKSKTTYLPVIAVAGESSVKLACDATGYTDPGAVATEGGVEIEMETDIAASYFGSSTIDGPDFYTISYSALNKDGIPGAEFRTVFWPECNGDLVSSIAGMYKATVVRNGSTGPQYTNIGPIFIKDLGAGQYQLSDAIGGYYEFGRGYGPDYASTGMVITANDIPTNDFTFGAPVEVGAFGGSNEMKSFSVNAGTKTIQFTAEWDAGFTFVVTLVQYEP